MLAIDGSGDRRSVSARLSNERIVVACRTRRKVTSGQLSPIAAWDFLIVALDIFFVAQEAPLWLPFHALDEVACTFRCAPAAQS